jgi:lysylphosphatidylglycerol synthetase-like protein (DUF2156 family)
LHQHRYFMRVATFMHHRQDVGKDLLLYVAIALLVAAVAVGYGVYLAGKGENANFKNDWSVAIATAALVFGYAIKGCWRLRRAWLFWVICLALLIAHFAILLPILSRMEKVPLILIGIIAPLEILIVGHALDFIVGRFNSRHI